MYWYQNFHQTYMVCTGGVLPHLTVRYRGNLPPNAPYTQHTINLGFCGFITLAWPLSAADIRQIPWRISPNRQQIQWRISPNRQQARNTPGISFYVFVRQYLTSSVCENYTADASNGKSRLPYVTQQKNRTSNQSNANALFFGGTGKRIERFLGLPSQQKGVYKQLQPCLGSKLPSKCTGGFFASLRYIERKPATIEGTPKPRGDTDTVYCHGVFLSGKNMMSSFKTAKRRYMLDFPPVCGILNENQLLHLAFEVV